MNKNKNYINEIKNCKKKIASSSNKFNKNNIKKQNIKDEKEKKISFNNKSFYKTSKYSLTYNIKIKRKQKTNDKICQTSFKHTFNGCIDKTNIRNKKAKEISKEKYEKYNKTVNENQKDCFIYNSNGFKDRNNNNFKKEFCLTANNNNVNSDISNKDLDKNYNNKI